MAAFSPAAPVLIPNMMAPTLPVEGARVKTVHRTLCLNSKMSLHLFIPTEDACGLLGVLQVESSDGILQNPLGTHECKRVWGGGIVKLRYVGILNSHHVIVCLYALVVKLSAYVVLWSFRKPNEWIPWPIDLLVKEENDRRAAADNGTLYPDLNSEHNGDGGERASFSHRVTDMAFGEGLGRISKVAWGDSVANVHTAAVPPWMVQSEEEYKRCNQRQLLLNGLIGSGSSPIQDTWTQQSGREQNGPSETRASIGNASAVVADMKDDISTRAAENDPNWLPNFGGVWQEGPRSKTKHEFAKLMPPRASALQFRPASVYQRRRQVASSQPIASTPTSFMPLIQLTPAAMGATPEPHRLQPSPTPDDTRITQNNADESAVPPPPPPPAEEVERPIDPMVRVFALTASCCWAGSTGRCADELLNVLYVLRTAVG